MNNLLWRAIAAVVCYPPITAALIWIAMRRPYFHLGDYMHRYWLIPFSWPLPISIRVHHILRADAEPYLHDHPWPWRTIILRGGYAEEDVFGRFHLRVRGDTRAASAETLHRIECVSDGGVWTLFIMYGRSENRWGFMVGEPARKMYYRDFLDSPPTPANDDGTREVERQG